MIFFSKSGFLATRSTREIGFFVPDNGAKREKTPISDEIRADASLLSNQSR
jgi:hypothetical protein